jgi:intergrase/recombinase
MRETTWAVYRLDFNGNEFLVEEHLTEIQARDLVIEYESRKHHQHYWASKNEPSRVDFISMLRSLLDSGSALSASLSVLRNQNASVEDCSDAVQAICDVNPEFAQRIVLNTIADTE